MLHSRGLPRRVSAYEISKSTGFHVDFGYQIGFLYFMWISGFLDFKVDFWILKVDFWISKWISGFESGFLDFKVDFYISKWILDFCLKNYCYSEDTGMNNDFSAQMRTEYNVTGTS